MHVRPFVLGEPIDLGESMTCELKEVKMEVPVQAISKVIDHIRDVGSLPLVG